jgi:hypothetical protein
MSDNDDGSITDLARELETIADVRQYLRETAGPDLDLGTPGLPRIIERWHREQSDKSR